MIDPKISQAFRDLIAEYQETSGFDMPELLREYLVELLAQRLTDTEVIPRPSFAERYLELQQRPTALTMRQFGDQCLFFVGLMPEYGQRRGISLDYYAALGISCYYTWGDLAHDHRGTQLGNWFYDLQRFLNCLLRNRRLELVTF